MRLAERIGRKRGHVLITGPTGAGKTEIAKIIFNADPRRGPVKICNAATLKPELAEAALFGTVKGAYTGAENRPGLFEAAKGGILFLDEIAELAKPVQASILTAAETGAFHRVGSLEETRVDVRLVVATNADLAADGFRDDLLARLAQHWIEVPGLAERGRDVLAFAAHLLETDPDLRDFVLTPDAEAALLGYAWPKNVREVRNVLRWASDLVEDPEEDPEITGEMIRAQLGRGFRRGAAAAGGMLVAPVPALAASPELQASPARASLQEAAKDEGDEAEWMPLVEYAERLGLSSDRPLKRAALEGSTYHGVPFCAEIRPMVNARGQLRGMWAMRLPGPVALPGA
ncbi:MAG: sigma 54-interacting transcriptional regulator [Myxococcales bacterium]|nr:sigma 54-interacting transcriptional regulator [Myxococcales bacterium]